ncbi:uncharacterized protein LOC142994561 [Genypterus blacodes]|uniref:uncharacterized protein LOC142994561 n=1 Tax=Genypterus blacodes TaxID=154954 RepID=UPI003F76DE66
MVLSHSILSHQPAENQPDDTVEFHTVPAAPHLTGPESDQLCRKMTGQTASVIIQELSVAPHVGVNPQEPKTPDRSMASTYEAVSILSSTSQLTFALKDKVNPHISNTNVKGCSSYDEDDANGVRRKREFTPDERKDEGYWDKRRKNNEAAKRSREKRRANDMVLERRILGLLEENAQLRAELLALKFRFGLVKDPSNVTILPLAASLCPHPTPSSTHYCQSHADGPPYSNTQPSTTSNHMQPPPPQQRSEAGLRRARTPLGHKAGSVSEESGISTSCGSNMGSPVFLDDTFGDQGRPSSNELMGEQQSYDPHLCTLDVSEGQYARQEPSQALRSLPHKLRFKVPNGGNDGGEGPLSDTRQRYPPIATVGPNIQVRNHLQARWNIRQESQVWSRDEACGGLEHQYQCPPSGAYSSSNPQHPGGTKYMTENNNNIRSQISCLSQEVAQLKRLFSQQLLSKIS